MKTDEVIIDEAVLTEIEEKVKAFSLSDAIREGSLFTEPTVGWGDGKSTACALTAATVALKNRGII
jgi:hypothetical protein